MFKEQNKLRFFFINVGVRDQLARTSTNPMNPEVNNHISL